MRFRPDPLRVPIGLAIPSEPSVTLRHLVVSVKHESVRCSDPLLRRTCSAFANPEVYEFLEAEAYRYTIRLPGNDVLERAIEPLLTRPVGRPPNLPLVFYYGFSYQAASWRRPRRVVAKVEWHAGELFPRVGFIVTNLRRAPRDVVRFYNQRGTAEQWDQGGQERGEVDAIVLPRLRGQPGPSATVRPGLQPGQLPATIGPAAGREALVADDLAGEVDQDRGEGGLDGPLRGLSDGGGGSPAWAVPGDPRTDSATQTPVRSVQMNR